MAKYRWKSDQVQTIVYTDMVTRGQSQQFHIAVGRLVDPPAPRVRKVKAVEKVTKVRRRKPPKVDPPDKGFVYLVHQVTGECTRLPSVPIFGDTLNSLIAKGYKVVSKAEYLEVRGR